MTAVATAKGFKFGDQEQATPNSIQQVAKLDAYIVAYHDGQGKPQARVVLKAPGSSETFIMQERINGSNVVTTAHEWFHKAVEKKLADAKAPEGEAAESI
jgi:hypothetical protein